MEYAALNGSEKQVAWANDIRAKMIAHLNGRKAEVAARIEKNTAAGKMDRVERLHGQMAVIDLALGVIAETVEAKDFIECSNSPDNLAYRLDRRWSDRWKAMQSLKGYLQAPFSA